VSFILDALRKSEHERQRSAVPGLSQVPLATPQPQLPRWALGVMAVLGAALLVVGGAWWQSSRSPTPAAAAPEPMVERNVELPPPSFTRGAPQQAAPSRPLSQAPSNEPSLASAAASSPADGEAFVPQASPAPRAINLPEDAAALRAPSATPGNVQSTPSANVASAPSTNTPSTPSVNLPSAASLAAEGLPIPTLHLELHAYSERPRDRFVFINGRKYVEGDRLPEGPQLVAIEPTGAVLSQSGRRFLIVQD
jgi:general secretion pathway protein B